MGHDVGLAGAEGAVHLAVVPTVDLVGLHADTLGVLLGADELIAVAIGHDLNEGPQIAGNGILIRVGLPDTLPVYILGADLLHKGLGGGDLVLGHGLHGQLDLLFGQGTRVAGAGAAGAIHDLHRNGDGLGGLTGQRTVHRHPGGVGRIGGGDHIGIAALDNNGRYIAVKAKAILIIGELAHISGGGEMHIGGNGIIGNGLVGAGVIELALDKHLVQCFLIVDAFLPGSGEGKHLAVLAGGIVPGPADGCAVFIGIAV